METESSANDTEQTTDAPEDRIGLAIRSVTLLFAIGIAALTVSSFRTKPPPPLEPPKPANAGSYQVQKVLLDGCQFLLVITPSGGTSLTHEPNCTNHVWAVEKK